MHGIAAKEYTNLCLLPCPSLPFSDISLLLSRKCWGTCSSHEARKIHPPGARTLCKGNLMSIHFTVMAFCKLATCVSLAPQLQDVTTFNTPPSCPPMFYLFSVTQGQLRPLQNTPNMRKREPKIGQANYSVACCQPTKVLPDITNLQREVGGCSLLCGSKMQNNNCIVPWNCDRNGSIFLFLALVRWRTRSFRQSCHV